MAKRGGIFGFFRGLVNRIGERINRRRATKPTRTEQARPTQAQRPEEVLGTPASITQPAGPVVRSGGGLGDLDSDLYAEYVDLWTKRESEKREALRSIKLQGIPVNKNLATVNIDPETGEIRADRGGNLVLTLLGDVQTPSSQAVLERRVEAMRRWKSVTARMDQSESNFAEKLGVIDYQLVIKWNRLSRAQKQYIINNEHAFDLLNKFTFSTDPEEVRAYMKLHPDEFYGLLDELHFMLSEAEMLEPEYE